MQHDELRALSEDVLCELLYCTRLCMLRIACTGFDFSGGKESIALNCYVFLVSLVPRQPGARHDTQLRVCNRFAALYVINAWAPICVQQWGAANVGVGLQLHAVPHIILYALRNSCVRHHAKHRYHK